MLTDGVDWTNVAGPASARSPRKAASPAAPAPFSMDRREIDDEKPPDRQSLGSRMADTSPDYNGRLDWNSVLGTNHDTIEAVKEMGRIATFSSSRRPMPTGRSLRAAPGLEGN